VVPIFAICSYVATREGCRGHPSLNTECLLQPCPHTPLFAVVPPPQTLPRRQPYQRQLNMLQRLHRGRRFTISTTTRTTAATVRAALATETIPSWLLARSLLLVSRGKDSILVHLGRSHLNNAGPAEFECIQEQCRLIVA
jgi:hypothetical protein